MKITSYEVTADLGTESDWLVATVDLDGVRLEIEPATPENYRVAKAVTLTRDQWDAVSAFMYEVKGDVWK